MLTVVEDGVAVEHFAVGCWRYGRRVANGDAYPAAAAAAVLD